MLTRLVDGRATVPAVREDPDEVAALRGHGPKMPREGNEKSFRKWIYRLVRSLFEIVAYMTYAVFFERFQKKGHGLPAIREKILLYPASMLTAKIGRKEIKVDDVVKAYIARIKAVNDKLNFLVDLREKDALQVRFRSLLYSSLGLPTFFFSVLLIDEIFA